MRSVKRKWKKNLKKSRKSKNKLENISMNYLKNSRKGLRVGSSDKEIVQDLKTKIEAVNKTHWGKSENGKSGKVNRNNFPHEHWYKYTQKILANWIQDHTKKITFHYQVCFIPDAGMVQHIKNWQCNPSYKKYERKKAVWSSY